MVSRNCIAFDFLDSPGEIGYAGLSEAHKSGESELHRLVYQLLLSTVLIHWLRSILIETRLEGVHKVPHKLQGTQE